MDKRTASFCLYLLIQSTYGPIHHVLFEPLLLVIPKNLPEKWAEVYYKALSYISVLLAPTPFVVIYDQDVRDGDTATHNMIVLGGPLINAWTKRRVGEGGREMILFSETGYSIGGAIYQGGGVAFIGPSPTRTRIGVYIGFFLLI